jgi:hypothetical protein
MRKPGSLNGGDDQEFSGIHSKGHTL